MRAIMGGLPTPRPGCVVEESPEGLRVIGKDDSSIDYTDQYIELLRPEGRRF